MAKKCVLCGEELGFLNNDDIVFCGVTQNACRGCAQQYRQAEGEEWVRLGRRIMSSPELRLGDEVKKRFREAQKEQERKRLEEERQARFQAVRAQRQKEQLACCGGEMEQMGTFTFQLGEHSFFLGDLSHLMSGSLELAMFRCPCCGQVKFFDPEIVGH